MQHSKQWYRYPLMALALLALLAGLSGGMMRLGWSLSGVLRSAPPLAHGPLMVCGFLGTLISLERAVALEKHWAFTAPLAAGLGGLLLLLDWGGGLGALLLVLGSLVLVLVFVAVWRLQPAAFVAVMGMGALAWLVGNIAWLLGAPVYAVVSAWMGFLVLTIAGERLELSRMLFHAPHVQRWFAGIAALLTLALLTTAFAYGLGIRLMGAALVMLAAWLARHDLARHTIQQRGLTRYIAACLLASYVWLGTGGVLALAYGGVVAGPAYDAMLHVVFVGFVFSMIFGHAPVIFPSVLGVPLAYRSFFYVHLALLHASLALRLAGDLAGLPDLRQWGGLLNAAAILLFLASTVAATLLQHRAARAGGPVVLTETDDSSIRMHPSE